jgi:ATP-dependent DNA helicase DinG
MIPTPTSLGLPTKFKEWRPNQWQAIQDGLECEKRFAVQVQRGGRGKTTTYMTQALLARDSRAILLTANKGLQDQALEDWAAHGLVDIRGRSSYTCDAGLGTCEDGSVSKCMYKGTSMCSHNNAVQEAKASRLVISNYSCWIASNKYGQGFGAFDLMICDEAHNIPQEVAKAMRVQFSDRELIAIKRSWPEERNDMGTWKQWAAVTLLIADKELERLKSEVDKPGRPSSGLAAKFKAMRSFTRKLADIATCRTDRWICGEWNYGYQFDVIDASVYTERILWREIPKIILTSGTIRPKTMEMCGVSRDNYEFFDYPSEVNPARSPLMQVRTGIKMSKNTPDYQKRQLVKYIDKIIEGRMDRKGIIHTANFPLRDFIKANSKYQPFMFTNYSGVDKTTDIIERFKNSKPPAVLISPSVTTGYDFPFDLCRYQIIAKLPYEDISSKVVQARLELDPKHAAYNMMQNLAQAFSRGDRGDEDMQEVFVLDENIGRAMWWYGDLAPSWLPAYFSVIDNIPPAMELEEACVPSG